MYLISKMVLLQILLIILFDFNSFKGKLVVGGLFKSQVQSSGWGVGNSKEQPGLKSERPSRKTRCKLLQIQIDIFLRPSAYQQIKIKEMCHSMLARNELLAASSNLVTLWNELTKADFLFQFRFDENKWTRNLDGQALSPLEASQRISFLPSPISLSSLVKSRLYFLLSLCLC